MREREYTKIIKTEFLSGGMEYKVVLNVKFMGKIPMQITVLKVYVKGKKSYTRVYPYDLELWQDNMINDIEQAVREEL